MIIFVPRKLAPNPEDDLALLKYPRLVLKDFNRFLQNRIAGVVIAGLLAACAACDGSAPIAISSDAPHPEASAETQAAPPTLGSRDPEIDLNTRLDPRPNILLYVVDTLRADHLGAYGNDSIRTPNFDRLASGGVVFTQTYANSSWTRPSMASLFTGLYPTRHGTNTRAAALPVELETLAERLSAAGWETAFMTANPNAGSAFGFEQGFDSMVELYARREPGEVDEGELVTPSNLMTTRALDWIDETDGPFFLVCLSIDPHQPLRPPKRFDTYGHGSLDFRGVLLEAQRTGMTLALFERIKSLYKATVSFTDDSFGGLMRGLEERDITDNTLVILTADHGEEFAEYGRVGHGLSLADPVVRVPLIMNWPSSERLKAGERVEAIAELIDVAPSVLDLVGMESPAEIDGRSLFSREDLSRPALSTLRLAKRDLQAAALPPWKLVNDLATGEAQLFDLDAGEAQEAERVGASAARKRLEAALSQLGEERPTSFASPEAELPGRTLEALRALGYVE